MTLMSERQTIIWKLIFCDSELEEISVIRNLQIAAADGNNYIQKYE